MGNGLRVAVVAQRLGGPQTGVARYLRGILGVWEERLPSAFDSVSLYSPTSIQVKEAPGLRAAPHRSCLPPLLWESLVLPRQIRHADVLFAPSFTMPLLSLPRTPLPPTVLVLHDAHQLLRPGDFGVRGRLAAGPAMRRSAARADRLVTVSADARDDLVRALGLPSQRVEVVPGGLDARFRPGHGSGVGRPYLLFVGKMSRRRNVGRLIEAAGLVNAAGFPHELILVGANSAQWPVAELAAQAGARVRHLPDVDDKRLVHLYQAAAVFVQAPLHETFSLPLLEALACGAPVVTSNQPVLRETGGPGATYVRPEDPADIAAAIVRLLSDPDLRAHVATQGLRHAATYRWEPVAARFAELLVEAASCGR